MNVNSLAACRLLTLCSFLVFVFAASDACAETRSFERSFTVTEPLRLEVETDSGSISIRGGRSGQAEVTGHATPTRTFLRRTNEEVAALLSRFEASPPVEYTNGKLLVGRNLDKDFKRYLTISYEIVVPDTSEALSQTDSGSQTISGIRGPVNASADSGSLTLVDIGGPVEASADSGTVRLTNIGASVSVETDSGSIDADGIAGAFEAHADSGDIRLTQTAPGDVNVSTDSGSSELLGVVGALNVVSDSGSIIVDGRQDGAWSLEADSGSVRVTLPADAAFNLDARSSSSGITIEHPITLQGKISDHQVIGDVRGGGSLLKIRTDSGRIRIH